MFTVTIYALEKQQVLQQSTSPPAGKGLRVRSQALKAYYYRYADG